MKRTRTKVVTFLAVVIVFALGVFGLWNPGSDDQLADADVTIIDAEVPLEAVEEDTVEQVVKEVAQEKDMEEVDVKIDEVMTGTVYDKEPVKLMKRDFKPGIEEIQ